MTDKAMTSDDKPAKLTARGRWTAGRFYRGHVDGDRFYRTRGWYHHDGWSR